jgi:hypothetical protein
MWGTDWYCNYTTTRVVEGNININVTAVSTDALQFYWVFRSEWLVVNKMCGGFQYLQKLQQIVSLYRVVQKWHGGTRHNMLSESNRIYTGCPTRYRIRHFFNVMSTAIPGEVWRPTSAEQVQHLGLVEETGKQGDFIGRAYRRSSKNECRFR